MKYQLRKVLLPVTIGMLIAGFWASSEFQEIAAGVAIFLFGMLMLEDGFRQFSGGILERILEQATRSMPRSMAFGLVTTTIVQSSSLISVITISFLSAGLISLVAGIGIVFGANIGTTTGAWLIAGFGLKVNISAYAMPLLVIGVVLVFQRSKYLRGTGYVLAGLGFLFLGIHHMKIGFETFKDTFDLNRYAMTGIAGLLVYTLVGALATVIMQSSHATLVLIITALAAGQISYENALALAIGANIGTTITAILGSLSANYLGKQLALSDVVFKVSTAAVALILIVPLRGFVDVLGGMIGIAEDDFALKVALFHTIFNVMGVAIMLPLLTRLIAFIETVIKEPQADLSRPKYLSEAVDEFPATIEAAMRKEVKHLYDNSVELIAHGLNLSRHEIFAATDVAATVRNSRKTFEFDIDERYETRVKTLYAAIVEFTTRTGEKNMPPDVLDRVYAMRDVAGQVVHAVKAVKHLRRNVTTYTTHNQGAVTEIYNALRTEIARILVEIYKLDLAEPEDRSNLWLDGEAAQVEEDARNSIRVVDALIRKGSLDADAATSFLNDSGYAYTAMRDLLTAARAYYIESDSAVAEVERILALDEDEVSEVVVENADATSENTHG
ncbi:Na/Pi cotransporter family protein [Sedimentitalea todarodis]|uniref:Na/Pi symporter n=1 Tax=Sedimentitalea todarodis TaxID=1631240 RepID=A0ABU3VGH9_9RHOB|nr:Na/Pi symporter [Sedimentitalea todarodis]MDU9005289.1 Na/Pi symporter [Sedimentitalea todarodis]